MKDTASSGGAKCMSLPLPHTSRGARRSRRGGFCACSGLLCQLRSPTLREPHSSKRSCWHTCPAFVSQADISVSEGDTVLVRKQVCPLFAVQTSLKRSSRTSADSAFLQRPREKVAVHVSELQSWAGVSARPACAVSAWANRRCLIPVSAACRDVTPAFQGCRGGSLTQRPWSILRGLA